MVNNNFKWLTGDIDSSLVLKVIYNKDNMDDKHGVFNVIGVLEATGGELDVETANIDDLTNLLTIGIVRFANIEDVNDVLDIPFRNLYKLYENGNLLGSDSSKLLSSSLLDTFLVVDGKFRNDFLVCSAIVDEVSEDLNNVMKIASDFGNYDMQEKFDALSKITMINHRRLVSEINNG